MSEMKTTVKCDQCKTTFEARDDDDGETIVKYKKQNADEPGHWWLAVRYSGPMSGSGVSISPLGLAKDLCLRCTMVETLQAFRDVAAQSPEEKDAVDQALGTLELLYGTSNACLTLEVDAQGRLI